MERFGYFIGILFTLAALFVLSNQAANNRTRNIRDDIVELYQHIDGPCSQDDTLQEIANIEEDCHITGGDWIWFISKSEVHARCVYPSKQEPEDSQQDYEESL